MRGQRLLADSWTGFGIFLLALLLMAAGTPRERLKELGIAYTPRAFIQRVEKNDIAAVRLFIAAGMDLNVKSGFDTPLSVAAQLGHTEVARLLIGGGANVNGGTPMGSPLAMAALGGHAGVARLLVDKGADVNFQDGWGNSVLLNAATRGDMDIVRLLVDKGADVNVKSRQGGSALVAAISNGRSEAVRYLISNNARLEPRELPWALWAAARQGDLWLMGHVLKRGGKPDGRWNSQTALMGAAQTGREVAVKLLVENGADVNLADENGDTALLLALANGHGGAARFLIEHGAAVAVRNNKGMTPLGLAKEQNLAEEVRMLEAAGAKE